MKKAVKITIMLMAFMLIMVTGCKNSFASTNVSSDAFKDEIRGDNASLTDLKVDGTPSVSAYDAGKKHRITLNFTLPVTEKVKDAVSFYELTNGEAADKPPKLSTTPLEVADFKLSGKTAYFVVNKDSFKDIYMYVTASNVQAINGQYMDQDGDTKWGEKDDDDFVTILQPSGTIVGTMDYLNAGFQNQTFSNCISVGFSVNTENNLDIGTLKNKITVSFANPGLSVNNFEDWGLNKDELGSIIENHIRVEQYTKDDSWKEITPNFTYNEADKNWTSPLDLEQNTQVRYKIINTDSIPALKSSKFTYDIKYTMESNLKRTFFSPIDPTGQKDDFVRWNLINNLSILTDDTYKLKYDTDENAVVFTLTPDNLTFNKYIDKTEGVKIVKPKIVLGKYESFKGFVDSTLTLDKFKASAEMSVIYKNTISGLKFWNGYKAEDSYVTLTLQFDSEETYKDAPIIFDRISKASSGNAYPISYNNEVTLYISDVIKKERNLPDTKISDWYSKLKDIYNALKDLPDNDFSYDFATSQSGLLKNFYEEVLKKVCEDFEQDVPGNYAKGTAQSLIKKFLAKVVEEKLPDEDNEYAADERGKNKMKKYNDSCIKNLQFLWISPEVKTETLTGVYTKNDGTSADIEIPSLSFATYAPSNDPKALNGWVKVE